MVRLRRTRAAGSDQRTVQILSGDEEEHHGDWYRPVAVSLAMGAYPR
jgi:hypothetical protein